MRRGRFLRMFLAGFPILAIFAVAIAIAVLRQRADIIADAERANIQTAAILAEQASQSVQAIELALEEIIDPTTSGELADVESLREKFGTFEAHRMLLRRLSFIPRAEAIAIMDATGRFVANSRVWPLPERSIGDREALEYHAAHRDSSMFVSASIHNVFNGEAIAYFTRGIVNGNGDFLGFVSIGVRPEYFIRLYEGLATSEGASVSLFRGDGRKIASYPDTERAVLDIAPGSEWFDVVARGGGAYLTRGQKSNVPRFMAVKALAGYPLVVTSGIQQDVVLARWRQRASLFAVRTSLLALAMAALASILFLQYSKVAAAERRLREQGRDLESANALFGAVMSNMRQGIAKYDQNDHLLYCNRAYAEMYGLTLDELPPGMHISKIWEMRVARGFYTGDMAGIYNVDRRTRLRSTGDKPRSTIDRLSDGRFIMMSHQPMANGCFVTTHEDITQREVASLEQHEKLEALVQSRTAIIQMKSVELQAALMKQRVINEQQRSFVAMASHEFRTPLAIVDSSAQKLIRRAKALQPIDIVERGETIRRAVQRMTGLMESVLSMAKFEHGEIKLTIREGDLYQTVFECCFRHADMSSAQRINFDLDELPRSARFDAKLIDQVITNLLANAIKFSPDSNRINVRASREGDRLRIDVEDFGIGIDAEDLPKLFTRYFRARTSTGIAGTGIGLDVVKMIVEGHGGEVGVSSTKGVGSVFSVFLPVAGSNSEALADDAGSIAEIEAAA